jgi:hypothetical protein
VKNLHLVVEFIASFPIAIFSKIFVTLTLHTFWRKVWRITNEQRNIGNIRNRIGKIEEDRMVYKFMFTQFLEYCPKCSMPHILTDK